MWLQSPLSCTPLQAWVLALESGLGFLCPRIDSCDEISYSLCKVPWDGKNRLLVWDEILMLIVVFLLKTISTKLIHSKFMTVNTSIYMTILLYFLTSKMILLVPMNFGGASPPTPAWRKCSVVTLPHKSTPDFPAESSQSDYCFSLDLSSLHKFVQKALKSENSHQRSFVYVNLYVNLNSVMISKWWS